MRRLAPFVVLVAAMAGLTSCSTPTNGQAVPGGSPDGTETSGSASRPTSSRSPGADDSPLASTDPCSLLTSSAKGRLGLTGDGEQRKVGMARGCRWRVREGSQNYIFDVGILDSAGISDVPGNVTVTELPKIGEHEAAQHKEGGGPGTCLIMLGVTDSSRVDTTVVTRDTQKSCELAMELAKLVEPELP